MNVHRLPFVSAASIATIYVVLATGIVRVDRKANTGGLISLQSMISHLTILPVSLTLEFSGFKIDYRSNWRMAFAIAFCAGLGLR